MQNYHVSLQSPVFTSYRCQRAANSVDLDSEAKALHELDVAADLATPYNIGLIVGASGSGKTTLAKQIFGAECFDVATDDARAVIDQFPDDLSYEQCVRYLTGMGLTSVPRWIRPLVTLSNGERARAIAALACASKTEFVMDEWTSVVDRTVAKAMSHTVQKFARKNGAKVTLLSCHYDVIDWLNPDWIIDCNKQQFVDRRLLWRDFRRAEQLRFDIRPTHRRTWAYFSKYHYLSDRLPGGHNELFGLFYGEEQIGFQCFSNYVPHRDKSTRKMMHSNRTVIHPDFVGLGLGILLINATSRLMCARGFDVRAKFSSEPVYRAFTQYADVWRLEEIKRDTPAGGGNMARKGGFRRHVKTYCYRWIGGESAA
jgi:ABC-type ATPase involved in cell division